MNYHLNQGGKEAGIFPLEELHRRRKAGELNGTENVWCAGMPSWLTLDAVLRQNGFDGIPATPAQPVYPGERKSGNLVLWLVCGGLAIFLLMIAAAGYVVYQITNAFKPMAYPVASSRMPVTAPGWTASEDYSEFVNAGLTHSVYISIGGYPQAVIDQDKAEGKPLPTNHSPLFAPDHTSAIRTGIEALTLAVLGVTGG